MTDAFQLICHHTYRGHALDLSDYDSHGKAIGVEFLSDGAAPGSGAAKFSTPTSKIIVPLSPASKALGGIKVEVTLRRVGVLPTEMGALVVGDKSFSFSHDGERLWARFEGPRHPLLDHPGLPTDSGGIISPRGSVMIGPQWTTVGFFHNGIDTMELYADGVLVAQRTDLLSNISVVGPQGITIGNHATVGVFLGGEFDEVKIWRLDPSIMDRQFFERIVDPSVADCWQRFFRSLAKALRDHPDCAARIHQLLAAMVYGNRQAIASTSPEFRQRYIQTCERYLELWRANLLDGPNMNALLTDWRAALQPSGFSFETDQTVIDLTQASCLRQILEGCAELKCDPQFAALLAMLAPEQPGGAATAY